MLDKIPIFSPVREMLAERLSFIGKDIDNLDSPTASPREETSAAAQESSKGLI